MNSINMNNYNDFDFMVKLIREDYENYQYASVYLKMDYNLIIEAIYSCQTYINGFEDKMSAYKVFHEFLTYLKGITGIDMKIIKIKDEDGNKTFSFVERQKSHKVVLKSLFRRD